MLYVLTGGHFIKRREFIHKLEKESGFRFEHTAGVEGEELDKFAGGDLFSKKKGFVISGEVPWEVLGLKIDSLVLSPNVIVLVPQNLDRRFKTVQVVVGDKRVKVMDFLAPMVSDLISYCNQRVRELGFFVEPSVIPYLVEQTITFSGVGMKDVLNESGLYFLEQELRKLSVFSNNDKPVALSEAQDLIPKVLETDVFKIIDALALGKTKEMLNRIEQFYLDEGTGDEKSKTIQLSSLLADQLRGLLFLHSAQIEKMPEQVVVEISGWKPGRIFMMKKLVGKLSPAKLKILLTKLSALDVELKSTQTPARVLMELILVG